MIALEALKLPKFLQIDIFVWPFLLLAAGVAGGLGASPVGWTVAAIVGAVAGIGAGIGAYLGLFNMARPGVVKHAARAQGDRRRRSLVEQNKDWVKNEFDGKLKELEEKPDQEGAGCRRGDDSPRRRIPAAPPAAAAGGRREAPGQVE